MSKLTVIIMLVAALRSCDKTDFENPQPEGVKSATVVPAEMKGRYVGVEDSSQLVASNLSLIVRRNDRHSMHISQVDSAYRPKIKSDTSFYDKNVFLRLHRSGDS